MCGINLPWFVLSGSNVTGTCVAGTRDCTVERTNQRATVWFLNSKPGPFRRNLTKQGCTFATAPSVYLEPAKPNQCPLGEMPAHSEHLSDEEREEEHFNPKIRQCGSCKHQKRAYHRIVIDIVLGIHKIVVV